MKTVLKTSSLSALVSLLPILPFIIMEVVNRREFHEGFPFMLFFILWLNLFAISLILLPVVRTLRNGGSLFAHPVNLIIAAFILSTIAFGVASLIIDQWPCFIGVPNCD